MALGITAGVGEQLRVIILGDWGEIKLRGQEWVAAGMAAWSEDNDPAFIITGGDNIYPKGLRTPDDVQMDIKWRNVYNNHTSLASLPWYVTLGNHDYGDWEGEEWNEIELSKIDPQWILPHLWYDFVEDLGDGSVHFVVIDTETFTKQIERNNYTDMLGWMDDTLRESTADWKFVIGHRHAFTAGDAGAVTTEIVDVLIPIMNRNNVDAYICGHDHNLQHLRNISGVGLDYVISGAGGALLSRYIQSNEDYIRDVYDIDTIFFEMTYGFVTLTVEKTFAQFDFFDQDAVLVYNFTRFK